jgi:hypothetical protein
MKKGECNCECGCNNSLGIVAVVCGIISIAFASIPGLILAIVGLIFAYLQNKKGTGWGKSAIILNIVSIVFNVLSIYLIIKYGSAIISLLNA